MHQTTSHFLPKGLSSQDFRSFNKIQTFLLAVSHSFRGSVKGLIIMSMLKKYQHHKINSARWMLFRVAHLKVDLGDLFLVSHPGRRGAGREGSFSRKTQNQGGPHQLPRSICTDVLRIATRRRKLVERGIAHTPEIKEQEGK